MSSKRKSNNFCNTLKIMWNDISNFFTRKTFSKNNPTRSNSKSNLNQSSFLEDSRDNKEPVNDE